MAATKAPSIYSKTTIRRVQRALNLWFAHRRLPAPKLAVDGEKGPATNAAIREFKLCVGWRGANVDTTIGPKFRMALGIDRRRYVFSPAQCSRGLAYRRELKSSHTARDRAVAYALSFAGHTTESPYGSNRGGPITAWESRLGFGAVPWCGIFAGNMLLHVDVANVTSRIAAVGLIEDDARARRYCFRGWTTSTAGVRPGDLVVLFGYGVHVEMVRSVGNGVVNTIGGNTSSGTAGSQSNGGGVYARTRPLSDVRGFALVNYPG